MTERLASSASRILIVDDEAPIRNICQRALKRPGFEVAAAATGEEAVARLGEHWDIIVTDITMPGDVDGFGVLAQAKAAGNADVLMMTGYPELNFAIKAVKLGAYDFILKPFSLDSLQTAVERCLKKRELSAELIREKSLRAELERSNSELARMQKVREAFGQFVTPEVAEHVLTLSDGLRPKSVLKRVSVLFTDVRSFTPFAAGVPPGVAVDTLNEVFSCIVPAVQKEGGILNKFMGDGLLALFGAPLDLAGHEEAAARAALCAMKAVEALGLPKIRIGIGINTGEVVAGCLGTESRTEYSVIGHTVNLASRLNAAAKPGQILLGADTAAALGAAYRRRKWGRPLRLPGITKPGAIWELLG